MNSKTPQTIRPSRSNAEAGLGKPTFTCAEPSSRFGFKEPSSPLTVVVSPIQARVQDSSPIAVYCYMDQPPPPEEFTFYDRSQHFRTYRISSSNPPTPDLDRLFRKAISGPWIFTADPPQDNQEMGVDYQEEGITGENDREERSDGEGMEQHHMDEEAGGVYWEDLEIYSDQERVTEGDDQQEQDPSFHWPQDPKQDTLSEEQQEESVLVDPHTITLEDFDMPSLVDHNSRGICQETKSKSRARPHNIQPTARPSTAQYTTHKHQSPTTTRHSIAYNQQHYDSELPDPGISSSPLPEHISSLPIGHGGHPHQHPHPPALQSPLEECSQARAQLTSCSHRRQQSGTERGDGRRTHQHYQGEDKLENNFDFNNISGLPILEGKRILVPILEGLEGKSIPNPDLEGKRVPGPGLEDSIPDIIIQCIVTCKDEGKKLESKYYSRYKEELYVLIFNDASTFRSELKKLCVHLVPEVYHMYALFNLPSTQAIAWVKERASALVKGAKFLRGRPNDKGEEDNFAHEGLYKIIPAFYYGKSCKLLGATTEFKDTIPSGTGFWYLLGSNHPRGSSKLVRQLARWAKAARRDIQEYVVPNVDEDEFAIAPMGD
ncbi:hypothetical protein F4604DRAFT_1680419 [Suillus subluteus]|nr:hypothetical protein F4604DRAFT_1680419 [Suillus subluteus]